MWVPPWISTELETFPGVGLAWAFSNPDNGEGSGLPRVQCCNCSGLWAMVPLLLG